MALSLAVSFAEARSRTLLIDADAKFGRLTEKLNRHDDSGWREALEGKHYKPVPYGDSGYLDILPVGHVSGMADTEIGIGRVRAALAGLKGQYELVILLCGSMTESVSTELLLSVADLGVAEVRPKDRKANIASQIAKLDSLPRQGGVLTFTEAKPGDPGL